MAGGERRYRKIGLGEFLQRVAPQLGDGRVVHHTSLAPVDVALSELRIGRVFLERWRVDEQPAGVSWRQGAYRSPSPAVLSFRNVGCFSSCGALLVDDCVIAETLVHADPAQHGFEDGGDWITLPAAAGRRLDGAHLGALCGSIGNYFHAVIDGIGRLAAVPQDLLAASRSVVTAAMPPAAAQMLEAFCSSRGLGRTSVAHSELVMVDELVVAFNVSGQCDYHPCLGGFFDAVAIGFAVSARTARGRAIYVDRRRSGARRLVNEAGLVQALQSEGVTAVYLEELDVAAQLRLFQSAGLVISPHGAGLTNLLFAQSGTMVLELLMDRYCNWSFRHLAGLKGLRYDCVIGRAHGAISGQPGAVHAMEWEISIDHVVAAMRQMAGL